MQYVPVGTCLFNVPDFLRLLFNVGNMCLFYKISNILVSGPIKTRVLSEISN